MTQRYCIVTRQGLDTQLQEGALAALVPDAWRAGDLTEFYEPTNLGSDPDVAASGVYTEHWAQDIEARLQALARAPAANMIVTLRYRPIRRDRVSAEVFAALDSQGFKFLVLAGPYYPAMLDLIWSIAMFKQGHGHRYLEPVEPRVLAVDPAQINTEWLASGCFLTTVMWQDHIQRHLRGREIGQTSQAAWRSDFAHWFRDHPGYQRLVDYLETHPEPVPLDHSKLIENFSDVEAVVRPYNDLLVQHGLENA